MPRKTGAVKFHLNLATPVATLLLIVPVVLRPFDHASPAIRARLPSLGYSIRSRSIRCTQTRNVLKMTERSIYLSDHDCASSDAERFGWRIERFA